MEVAFRGGRADEAVELALGAGTPEQVLGRRSCRRRTKACMRGKIKVGLAHQSTDM
jgi:hypothetical protein